MLSNSARTCLNANDGIGVAMDDERRRFDARRRNSAAGKRYVENSARMAIGGDARISDLASGNPDSRISGRRRMLRGRVRRHRHVKRAPPVHDRNAPGRAALRGLEDRVDVARLDGQRFMIDPEVARRRRLAGEREEGKSRLDPADEDEQHDGRAQNDEEHARGS